MPRISQKLTMEGGFDPSDRFNRLAAAGRKANLETAKVLITGSGGGTLQSNWQSPRRSSQRQRAANVMGERGRDIIIDYKKDDRKHPA
jgi:hypothetical protein